MPASVECDIGLAPQTSQDCDLFLDAAPAVAEIRADRRVLGSVPAEPYAELETPTAELLELGALFGHDRRRKQRQYQQARSKVNMAREPGKIREYDERIVERPGVQWDRAIRMAPRGHTQQVPSGGEDVESALVEGLRVVAQSKRIRHRGDGQSGSKFHDVSYYVNGRIDRSRREPGHIGRCLVHGVKAGRICSRSVTRALASTIAIVF